MSKIMLSFPLTVCFLVTLLKLTSGIVLFNRCPRPPVQENFDLRRFVGRWYELYTYTNGSIGSKCYTVDYEAFNRTLGANGTQQQQSTFGDGYTKTVNIMGTFSESEPAKINVLTREYGVYYWILDTDYVNYALVWRCFNPFFGRGGSYTESAWILGRRNTISQDAYDSIIRKLPRYGLQQKYFVKDIHDGSCTYPTCL